MIITNHWSGSSNDRIKEYHVTYGTKLDSIPASLLEKFNVASPGQVDWDLLFNLFNVWKNTDLHTPTPFGTYRMNHDPRDGSADIEVGALCMGGEYVTPTGSWGSYPFTRAHAWMAAGICARIAQICTIDCMESFTSDSEYYINGPFYAISTHAERAHQTVSPDAKEADRGYDLYSGDPDCRWDLAVLCAEDNHRLGLESTYYGVASESANWIRTQAHAIKSAGIKNLWGLDKNPTP